MRYEYSELMAASGMLMRAAYYLLNTYGADEAVAMGTLTGLAYSVRPQLVK